MRYFQSHESVNCCFLPTTHANKNSKQVWGIEIFQVTVYKSQNLFILVLGWITLAYLKVLGRLQSPGWGELVLVNHSEKPFAFWMQSPSDPSLLLCAVPALPAINHHPFQPCALFWALSLRSRGAVGSVCVWCFILIEVGAAGLQKTCQQTRGAGLTW